MLFVGGGDGGGCGVPCTNKKIYMVLDLFCLITIYVYICMYTNKHTYIHTHIHWHVVSLYAYTNPRKLPYLGEPYKERKGEPQTRREGKEPPRTIDDDKLTHVTILFVWTPGGHLGANPLTCPFTPALLNILPHMTTSSLTYYHTPASLIPSSVSSPTYSHLKSPI